MPTPELLNIPGGAFDGLVMEVFESLMDGNATPASLLALGQTLVGKVNQFVNISEDQKKSLALDVFEKAVVKVENEVVVHLSDSQKKMVSDNLEMVRKTVKDVVPSAFALVSEISKGKGLLSQVVSMLSKLLPGACCNGRPLPELPSQVQQVIGKIQPSVVPPADSLEPSPLEPSPLEPSPPVPSPPVSLELRIAEEALSSKEVQQNLPEEEKVPQENKTE